MDRLQGPGAAPAGVARALLLPGKAARRTAGRRVCEHVRWESAGTLFVALNVPGSNNNVRHPEEYAPRMQAVFAWIDESAALARERRLRLALLMQADPFVTTPRDGYGALRDKLRELGATQRTVLIHGDTHLYRDDEPIPGVRRIEVWGSPVVDWLRVAF